MIPYYNHIDSMWHAAVSECRMSRGTDSRNGGTHEVIGWAGQLLHSGKSWLKNPRRALSPTYAAAEVLWYLGQRRDVGMIRTYAPQYEKFAEDDGIVHGAYGPRMADQVTKVITVLRAHPESRQAVVQLWQESDLEHAFALDKRDLPCTLTMQFLKRGQELHMVVSMRSNDVWLGLPYDVFAFTCVQRLVAGSLGLVAATYTHMVGSLHLYDKHWTSAREAQDILPENDGHVGWPNEDCWGMRFHACQAEEDMRTGRFDPAHDYDQLPEHGMLRDLVTLCSVQHLGELAIPVFSDTMQKGLERHADRRRD